MPLLIHISDLHFGATLAKPNDRFNNGENLEELAKIFGQKIKLVQNRSSEKEIAALIISGDITHSHEGEQFDNAEIFINYFAKEIGIDIKKQLLIIPGNHDVNWKASKNEAKFSEYRRFYLSLFPSQNWNIRFLPVISYTDKTNNYRIVCFGFNSLPIESKERAGKGFIDPIQFEQAHEWLLANESSTINDIRFAVLHHHVLPVESVYPEFKQYDGSKPVDDSEIVPISTLLNAPDLLHQSPKLSLNAILHGHVHIPYYATYTDHSQLDVLEPRIITIIGAGSALQNINTHQFQIIEVLPSYNSPTLKIHPVMTDERDKSLFQMVIRSPKELHNINGHNIVDTLNEGTKKILSELSSSMYKIIQRLHIEFSQDASSVYDSILDEICLWLKGNYKFEPGAAIIQKFNPTLQAYKGIAKSFTYDEDVRYMAYPLNAPNSITAEFAKKDQRLFIVPSRKKYKQEAKDNRKQFYSATFGNDPNKDQTVACIKLHRNLGLYPETIIQFARNKNDNEDSYSSQDLIPLVPALEIIENALGVAQMYETARQKRYLSFLYPELLESIKQFNSIKLNDLNYKNAFNKFSKLIYDCFGLKSGDSVAFFTPIPANKNVSVCVGQFGFTEEDERKMEYTVGESIGLTGKIIDSSLYDYCIDHLNGNKSKNGHTTSKQCEKKIAACGDYKTSFVGVPLYVNPGQKYFKGALIINTMLPITIVDEHNLDKYISDMFIRPMQIVAKLLEDYIEISWKDYYTGNNKGSNFTIV